MQAVSGCGPALLQRLQHADFHVHACTSCPSLRPHVSAAHCGDGVSVVTRVSEPELEPSRSPTDYFQSPVWLTFLKNAHMGYPLKGFHQKVGPDVIGLME